MHICNNFKPYGYSKLGKRKLICTECKRVHTVEPDFAKATEPFKRNIAEKIINGELTITQAVKETGFSRNSIRLWKNKYLEMQKED